MKRTYGNIRFDGKEWIIDSVEPHVAIKLKALFTKIMRSQIAPFHFDDTIEDCADLFWFTQRYHLEISQADANRLKKKKNSFYNRNDNLEVILSNDYEAKEVKLKDGFEAREYQSKGSEVFLSVKRMLLGDDLGLGKTVSAIISMREGISLPAVVVCQPHLIHHWKEKIEMFTNLSTHTVKGTTPYSLPTADVYIFKYTCLRGWVDVFPIMNYKFVIFDEIQEVRRHESQKHQAAKVLSTNSEYTLGLSATPIYNYGGEIFNIMEVIKPYSLGTKDQFSREWCSWGDRIREPKALGTYLREKFLFLRRTREEVGRELPPVNTIIHKVDYDEEKVRESQELARTLALKVMEGSFVERGQAARELDMMARYTTGLSKAKYVAEYVKFLVQSGEPVVLAGWHRDVYEIWQEQLKDFKVVMYTGSESPAKKNEAKIAFMNGDADIFIISLRSGIGLDGLQFRSKTVVFGELDWSPQVHGQLIGRVDRDGQKNQVTAIYLISEEGSDLPIIDMLGLKSSQSQNIINPLGKEKDKFTDESRMKKLAEQYLKNYETQE